MNARRIVLHYDDIKLWTKLDALLQFSCEKCHTAQIGHTLSRMRALPPKLGGNRCICSIIYHIHAVIMAIFHHRMIEDSVKALSFLAFRMFCNFVAFNVLHFK